MPMILDTSLYAISKGTFVIDAAFLDEADLPTVPSSATFTLTDGKSVVINGRSNVVITPLTSTIYIVLSGADLDYASGAHRVCTVTAIYNSTRGSNLRDVDSIRFMIADPESGKIGV